MRSEKHPATAGSYNNLAYNLDVQGRYSEAQLLYEKALELRLELLGEKHPDTAMSYHNLAGNLAGNLADRGKYAEAQPLYLKALDLRLELLGEKHPDVALSYNGLASNLYAQGKYAEAQPLIQKALELGRELLGDKHPMTAKRYHNLAVTLRNQGKYAEAQPLHEKALELTRESLGEKHPETARCYDALAVTLNAQGRYADAQPLLARAAAAYEASRVGIAASGLDRAVFGSEYSPYATLAITQAELASPQAAWSAAEADLARGLSDEAAARRVVALSAEELTRQAVLSAQLNELQPRILRLVTKQSPSDAEQDELVKLRDERRTLEANLAELAAALSQRECATLAQVQAALPADAALVLWVGADVWGCVVRQSGDPIWERLPGTGTKRQWTDDDSDLPRKLTSAVAGHASVAEIDDLAAKLYAQRIAPLEKHLEGVKRLFVVPVNRMAGVPLDVLTEKFIISYVPSGTYLARLKDRPDPSGASLLALGDPVFPTVEPMNQPSLPPGGVLITQVLPRGNGARAGLNRGDVLLTYAGAELTSFEQLIKLVERHGADKSVAITVWREEETADGDAPPDDAGGAAEGGKPSLRATTLERDVPPGKLGVVLDLEPASQAIAAKREADQMLLAVARGGHWTELPGTAFEVAALTTLAGADQATLLTRSSASEQALEQLRSEGRLAAFRYLHFATHGEPNNARSFESALVLAQDQLTGDIPLGGGKFYDGRLTGNEVLETWKLDNAELVTLSACESALGRPGGGDGALGFAQAFLLAGARAVCLSLWKVDDTATSLLMDRFYQNLLGKREGLAERLPKAEALAEAKRWLRELSVEDARALIAEIKKGVERGGRGLDLGALDGNFDGAIAGKPYAHPRYWSAFVLIGDPD